MKEKLEIYLKENLVVTRVARRFDKLESSAIYKDGYVDSISMNEYIDKNLEEDTFQMKLFKFIDSKNLKDSDVYSKVNIDRRLFSKIRSDKYYHPSKETIILLGIALELTEDEIVELLESASYSLPKNTTYDLIIRFCFKEHIYNINVINEFLYDHNCKVLN